MYLKTVDKFNEFNISAYATAANLRLMLVHEARNDDGIRNFFTEVHELLIKAMLNPLFNVQKQFSIAFDGRVRAIAKRWLL